MGLGHINIYIGIRTWQLLERIGLGVKKGLAFKQAPAELVKNSTPQS